MSKTLYELITSNKEDDFNDQNDIIKGVRNALDDALNFNNDMEIKLDCIGLIAKMEKNHLDSEKAKIIDGTFDTYTSILQSPSRVDLIKGE